MPETLADTASGQAGLDPAFHCSGRALYWTERLNPKKRGRCAYASDPCTTLAMPTGGEAGTLRRVHRVGLTREIRLFQPVEIDQHLFRGRLAKG